MKRQFQGQSQTAMFLLATSLVNNIVDSINEGNIYAITGLKQLFVAEDQRALFTVINVLEKRLQKEMVVEDINYPKSQNIFDYLVVNSQLQDPVQVMYNLCTSCTRLNSNEHGEKWLSVNKYLAITVFNQLFGLASHKIFNSKDFVIGSYADNQERSKEGLPAVFTPASEEEVNAFFKFKISRVNGNPKGDFYVIKKTDFIYKK